MSQFVARLSDVKCVGSVRVYQVLRNVLTLLWLDELVDYVMFVRVPFLVYSDRTTCSILRMNKYFTEIECTCTTPPREP